MRYHFLFEQASLFLDEEGVQQGHLGRSSSIHKSQIVSDADDSSLGDAVNARFTADDGSVLELHQALPFGDCLVHSLNGNNSAACVFSPLRRFFLNNVEE